LFLSPVPEDIGRYYPDAYYPVPSNLEQLSAKAAPERYKIDLVRRFVPGGRLLEVGPAYGTFAHLARETGFDVTAVERDARCCRFLRDVVGVRTIRSDDVAPAVEKEPPYDVIAMWHVLEHLPDPWRTLDALASKLAPGGILVVATPNPEAWQSRVLGTHWPHLDAPRHLWLIPPSVLSRKAAESGLEIALLTTRDKGSLGWNAFGWQYFLSNFFRSRLMRMGMYVAGSLLGVALAPIEGTEGKGSAYTIVMRRAAR
jgi:SAM-dependent methyltransferase